MQFINRSISRKLLYLVTITIALSVAAFGSISVWRETETYKQFRFNELTDQSIILATVISKNVSTQNRNETFRNLSVINKLSSIDYIEVTTNDGQTLANLGNGTITISKNQNLKNNIGLLSLLNAKTVSLNVPITHAGQRVGELTVYSKTTDLKPQIQSIVHSTAIIAISVTLIGLIAAWFIQRSVTAPLYALTDTMEKIEKTRDYKSTLNEHSTDEIKRLIRSFNTMLSRIQERDDDLSAHRKSLETTVAIRTQQYKEARDDAEKANAAKSDFLAMISHEIRTPLNGMLVMAELMTKAKLPEAQNRHANVIFNSGTTLLSIINDILDLSKIESGKMDLEEIHFNPAQSIEDVISLYTDKANEQGLTLKTDIASNLPEEIVGDPVRISQIISNLVNNAIKFTNDGIIQVSCKVITDSGASPVAYFSVEDSGIGISKDKQDSIFEAFSQADQSTTRLYGGTGLGLSICRRLVGAMRGKIGLTSEEGKGSKFWFAIPTKIVESNLAHAQHNATNDDTRPHEINGRANLKILVADDNPINIEVMNEALQQLGLKSDSVINGHEAVIAAQSGHYNFIFMDGSMPVLDGFCATKKIREWEEQQKRTPMTIVALSAHVAGTQASTYLNAGMNDYIAKPFTLNTLVTCLEKFSSHHQQSQSLSA